MELFVADARRAKIVDDVKLPADAAKALRAYAALRKGPTTKIDVRPRPLDAPCVFCGEAD